MKQIEFEEWKIDHDVFKIYTNSKRLFNKVAKELKAIPSEVYMMKGIPIAWDIVVDKKNMPKVRKIFKEAIKQQKKNN